MKRSNRTLSLAITAAVGILTLGLASTTANASTTNFTQFTVTANVPASCTISATPLAFGTYTGAAAVAAMSTVTVTCTNTTPYNVGLDKGVGTGATAYTRQMTGPNGFTLGYGLYQDSGHGTNWGTTIGTDTQQGTGTGAAQPINVYGQIPAGENVAPGSYTDTISATVTY